MTDLKNLRKMIDDLKDMEKEFFEEFGMTYEHAKFMMVKEWAKKHNETKNVKYV